MKLKTLMVSGLLMMTSLAVSAVDLSAFPKKCMFTLSGYAGASSLTDFPVLLRISSSISGFDYSDVMAGGQDICITDAAGNQIPHEIDTWNPNGESLIWVKVPVLVGSTTKLFLYYGSGTPTSNSPADVWTRYVAVVHGGASPRDSTAHGLTVTMGGGATQGTDAGCIGAGNIINDGSSFSNEGLYLANPQPLLSDPTRFTVSGWTCEDLGGTHIIFGSMSSWGITGYLVLNENCQSLSFTSHSGSVHSGHNLLDWTWTPGAWKHVAVVYDYTTGTSFYNGNTHLSVSIPWVGDAGCTWAFGNAGTGWSGLYLRGKLDEWRVLDGAASADWMRAEYDSVANIMFAVADAVTDATEALPTSVKLLSISHDATGAVVRGVLDNLGDGVSSATISVVWSADAGLSNPAIAEVGVCSDTIPFSMRLTDLSAGERWYVAFKAVNSLGATVWSATNSFHFATYLKWRPQNSGDGWDSLAWQYANGSQSGTTTTFFDDAYAEFDGAESLSVENINVQTDAVAHGFEVSGSQNYNIIGKVVDTPYVTKSGSGTFTVSGRGFRDPDSITVSGGTMRLGADSAQYALGTRNTPIYVRNASFDLNYVDANDHAATTTTKRFVVLGTGADAEHGTVYNGGSTYSTAAQIVSLELEGDATIGSRDGYRMDFRPGRGRPNITGPVGSVLSVLGNPDPAKPDNCLCFDGVDLNVGVVRLLADAVLSYEGDTAPGSNLQAFNLEGGAIRFWSVSRQFNVPVSAVSGVNSLGTGNGSTEIAAPINVAASAELNLIYGSDTVYRGGISCEGVLRVVEGSHFFCSGISSEVLEVLSPNRLQFEVSPTVGMFIDHRSATNSDLLHSKVFVTKCFVPYFAAPLENVELGTETAKVVALDLSNLSAPFNISLASPSLQLTFAANATIVVEPGLRLPESREASVHLVEWTAVPRGVTFVIPEDLVQMGYRLNVRETGLFLKRNGMSVLIR